MNQLTSPRRKISRLGIMATFFVLLATGAFVLMSMKRPGVKTATAVKATTYYYTYVGAQTPTERKKGTNYINPQTSLGLCGGQTNECAVQVSVTSSTPPANISTLSISYDATTGRPVGGDDFEENYLKN